MGAAMSACCRRCRRQRYIEDPPKSQGQLRALFDYEAMSPGDISFRQDELLEIIREEPGGWLWVKRSIDGSTGYAPSNLLQPIDQGPESLPCWHNIDRLEAQTALTSPGLQVGTYLLRPCQRQREVARYTLSVLKGGSEVGHFLVKSMDSGGYYIDSADIFPDIESLLQFYSRPGNPMATSLTVACPHFNAPSTPFREFEISRKLVRLGEVIGRGHFGEVYKAKIGTREVAVKTMKEGNFNKEDFLQEGRTLQKLQHRKIVQLIGVCSAEDPVYIITEFMMNGDLRSFLLKDRKVNNIGFQEMVVILLQIADGMTYLEEQQVIHRDLRAANILVGDNYTVKVADFGLSKFLDQEVYSTRGGQLLPLLWTAPEAQMPPYIVSVKSDVWSFGVLTFEVITRGEKPYKGVPNPCEGVAVGYRMPNPRVFAEEERNNFIYDTIMTECWHSNPEDRISFAALYQTLNDVSGQLEANGQYQR